MKHNGYHDAENEVDPETDDEPERIHSGKLSESSGYAGSDLYDYKVGSLSLSLCICVAHICINFKIYYGISLWLDP